uniref:Uncharacterized protein n=1 Tax=Myoviridae sp. ctcyQ27 TaxID=2825139 RepID=A0A8S5UFK5_9CAUD|nr:MAG TPA: hypothetical protein [Myoviridae sp. ctcyQ27]
MLLLLRIIRFASLSSKSIVGGSVQIHQPFYFFL